MVTHEVLNKIDAKIELKSGRVSQTWPAKVKRISETVDLNQATVGVILEITQDLTAMRPGKPPLLNGMFIKASLIGQASPQFSVPEKALHTNRIYLMSTENTLKIVPVTVLYRNQLDTVIQANDASAIAEGDLLVLNDLLPAIEGMGLSVKKEQSFPEQSLEGNSL
jgi:multidrug efflux pump subunit AcrA (membrane-fusion protein)